MKNASIHNAAMFLLFVTLFFFGIYYAANILIPVIFAVLIAMLLLPLCKKFESWGIHRIVSIIFCLTIVLIIIVGFIFFFSAQIINLANDIILIKQKLLEKLYSVQAFITQKTNITAQEQTEWFAKKFSAFLDSSADLIQNIIIGFTGALISFGLIVVYIFFFLLYRDRFKVFILRLFREETHTQIEDVIYKTKNLILHYLSGLLIALTILGTMNTIGLLALDIKQAVFLGYLAGFLNIIPYVGTLIGSLFPILMALLFKDSMWYAVGVTAIFLFNQFIDNNITTPNVVGSHVQVNPLATILAIIIGGTIWGVAGMILFIPLVGIFKIICDNVEDLKPIGYLLGEEEREKSESGLFKKIKRVFKRK